MKKEKILSIKPKSKKSKPSKTPRNKKKTKSNSSPVLQLNLKVEEPNTSVFIGIQKAYKVLKLQQLLFKKNIPDVIVTECNIISKRYIKIEFPSEESMICIFNKIPDIKSSSPLTLQHLKADISSRTISLHGIPISIDPIKVLPKILRMFGGNIFIHPVIRQTVFD